MSSLERDVRTCLTWPIALLIVVFPIPLATSAVSRLDYVFCPFVAPGQPQVRFGGYEGADVVERGCLPWLASYSPQAHSLTRTCAACAANRVHSQPAFYWDWYCSGKEQSSTLQSFMRAFIMGWLPSLLLNLWLGMVLPRLVYLVVQVGTSRHHL
jgi:hypothetical protein